MFESAAAQEVIERRRQILAGLRSKGVLVVETTPGALRTDAINEYLEVKARGLL
jgi:predicted nuclease with RNAse H fold